jgi:fluoroacetyl-CoA thioesterase
MSASAACGHSINFTAVPDPNTYRLNFVREVIFVAKDIPIGARGEAEETVEFEHTLTSHHPELPPVYSTPDMVRLMETAAFRALQPYCEGDEITVGTSIHIDHRAASGMGARIKAEGVLESFDGRFYTVRVTARDEAREIGRGTVGRAVVSVGKFTEKMKSQRD